MGEAECPTRSLGVIDAIGRNEQLEIILYSLRLSNASGMPVRESARRSSADRLSGLYFVRLKTVNLTESA
jgi:hypothetical protein